MEKEKMGRRLADGGVWDQAWFRKLSPKMKATYLFLWNKSDIAGMWSVDFDLLEFFVGEPVSREEIEHDLKEHVIFLTETLVHIRGFIDITCGCKPEELKTSNNFHKSVRKRLFSIKEILENHPLGKELLASKEGSGPTQALIESEDRLIAKYRAISPTIHSGGSKDRSRFREQITTKEAAQKLERAIENYANYLSVETWRAPKTTFSTFLGTKQSGYFWEGFIESTVSREPEDEMFGVIE